MENRIMTLHPDPDKKGVNISQEKYEMMRNTILKIVQDRGIVTFKDLNTYVGEVLEGKFDGSLGWYVTTVKLDLEARELIERIPGSDPQKIRHKV